MDYLRRLHPVHADRRSAARLDAPVAMAAAAALPPAMFEEASAPPSEAVRVTAPDTTPRGARTRPLTEPSPRSTLPAEVAAAHSASRQPSAAAAAATPLPPLQVTRSALPPSVLPALTTPWSLDAALQPAPPAAASPLTHADARPSPAAHRAEPAAVAVASQPLRLEAVRERERSAADEPAPVIHVTIDRIDVRLPGTAATPPTPARRRAAPAVGALGDYLRGRPPETRS